MEIRVKLPEDLVARLPYRDRSERDERIRLALEEYLEIPILDSKAQSPRAATHPRPADAAPRRRR
jgi:hypothetical protein